MYTRKINIIIHNVDKERQESWQRLLKESNIDYKILSIKHNKIENIDFSQTEDYLFIGCEEWLHEMQKIASAKSVFVITKDKDNPIKGSLNNIFAVWYFDCDSNLSADETNFLCAINYIKDREKEELNELWLKTIFDTSPDLIWFKDAHGKHLDANKAYCQIAHKEKKDIIGKTHQEVWDDVKYCDENSCNCLNSEVDVLEHKRAAIYYEDIKTTNGDYIKLKTYKAPIFKDGVIIGVMGIARDITKEFEYTKNIEQLAHYDQLTGLGNRNKLETYLSTAKTSKMIIVYMDMDNFKNVNDTYGHLIGDNAIKMLAKQIKTQFSDAVNIRWGGDEFISIFVNNVSLDDIAKRVEEFVKHFKMLCQEIPMFDTLSVSAGVAEGQLGHGSFEKLLQKADKALYLAKEKNKGGFSVFKENEGVKK